jgi:putative transposase
MEGSPLNRSTRTSSRPGGYHPGIQEEPTLPDHPDYKPRRWVVERVHSWINRFRRLLIRWEKKPENYEAMLQFACGIIVWEQTALLG